MAEVLPIKNHGLYSREQKASAAKTLRDALANKPKEVVVIFYDQGGELRVGGHPNDPGNALWMMEMAKAMLLGLR
jgi:hypothetical protein